LDVGITLIVFDAPIRGTSTNIAHTLYLESTAYILLLIVWVYLHWNFAFLFLQGWRFGRSRSF